MALGITINVPDFGSAFEKFLREEIRLQFKSFINTEAHRIELAVQEVVREAIVASPEYTSLLSGELRYAFGLLNAEDVLVQITDLIVQSVIVRAGDAEGGSFGSIIVEIIPTDLTPYFNVGAYVSISLKNGHESLVPWLKWLLTEGTNTVVAEFRLLNKPIPSSRTGEAIMIPGSKGFSVNAVYAGTEDNNWFTRTLDSISDVIMEIIGASI